MGSDEGSRLSVKVGCSSARNSDDAVREALAGLGEIDGGFDLVFVYSSIKHDVQKILDAVRRKVGDVPTIGCTTTGELSSEGFLSDGLVISGIASELLDVGVGFGTGVFGNPKAAAVAAVKMARAKLDASDGPKRRNHVCIMHAAGFTMENAGVEEEVLEAIQESLGDDWMVMGGSASDGARFLGSKELVGNSVREGSVVVALLATDLDVGNAMAHGYVPTDRTFEITEARENIIKRIDGKLALDFWAKILRTKPKKITKGLNLIRMTDKVPKFLMGMSQKMGLTPKAITEKIPFFKYATENPFAIRSESGEFVVKVPKVITPEGWIEFQTRMDKASELTLMKLDTQATVTASSRAVTAASKSLENPARLVLVYECLGRFMYLLDDLDLLYRNVRNATDGEIVGFFSAAEQGTMEGMGCQSHNYSVSVLAIG